MSFADLGLSESVLKAVQDAGYAEPTPIQKQAIPQVLQGQDVLGCAQTGTGKTAGFTLPMIDILARGRAKARMPRSLILEPTRELAAQVSENFEKYGKYNKLSMALLIGGVSFDDQMRAIDRGVDVLIATPGRLLDHTERGRLLLRGVEVLVIDEADRMLDMGFIPDVERIVQLVNPTRQTLFFSATMPPEIRRLADKFLREPVEIEVAPPASPAATVDQSLVVVDKADKRAALRALLRNEPVKNAFIFCNRKRDVDVVCRSLNKHGLPAAALHGDMTQSYRTETLDRFKKGEINLLVCSDVAARGLDVAGMSHVFLFDVPIHAEDYVHRIGRTGRAGMTGRSFTLATPEDSKYLHNVQKLIGREIPPFTVDGLDAPELDEDTGDRRRRKGGARQRKPDERKNGRGPRKSPSAAPAEAREPVAAQAPAEVQEPAEDREETPPGGALSYTGGPAAGKPCRPEKAKMSAGKRRRDRSGRDRHEDDEPVVGMGDHVPAFLLRPVRWPA